MHTLTLITVDVEKDLVTIENPRAEKDAVALNEMAKACESELSCSIVAKLIRSRINCTRDEFSSAVDEAVWERMEPYGAECTNSKYCEFHNENDSVKEEYELGTLDCIKEPGGEIKFAFCERDLIIKDGKVYEKDAGQLHHEKRTKKAKKYTALPDYPFRKLYPTLKEYAENYCNYVYSEEEKAYGYYYNPNVFWDWYSIGGRWPFMFLVKSDCREYSVGERDFGDEDVAECPEGYKWAVAARKKDIEWDALYEWRRKCATERFYRYEEMFKAKKLDEGFWGTFTAKGIQSFSSMLYIAGETLEEHLARIGLSNDLKYHSHAGAFLDLNDEYRESSFEYAFCGNYDVEWCKCIDEFIDSVSDDTVIVAVDCHF